MKLRKLTDLALDKRTLKLWARMRRTVDELEAIRKERVRRQKVDESLPGLLPSTRATLDRLEEDRVRASAVSARRRKP